MVYLVLEEYRGVKVWNHAVGALVKHFSFDIVYKLAQFCTRRFA